MINGIKSINEGIAYSYNLPKEMYPTFVHKGSALPVNNDEKLTATINLGIKRRRAVSKIFHRSWL